MDDNTRDVLMAALPIVGSVAMALVGRHYRSQARSEAQIARVHAEIAVKASGYPARGAPIVSLAPSDVESDPPSLSPPSDRPTPPDTKRVSPVKR